MVAKEKQKGGLINARSIDRRGRHSYLKGRAHDRPSGPLITRLVAVQLFATARGEDWGNTT